MAVGIAEIDALAAARPFGAAFDGDAGISQLRFPFGKRVRGDRERDVHRAAAVVWWNGAAGQLHGLQRMAAEEQQQHAARADVIGAQPGVAIDAVEPEHLLVERTGALEGVDVEHGFEHADEVGHGYLILQMWSTAFSDRGRASLTRSDYPVTGTISRIGERTSRVTALDATTARCCA